MCTLRVHCGSDIDHERAVVTCPVTYKIELVLPSPPCLIQTIPYRRLGEYILDQAVVGYLVYTLMTFKCHVRHFDML